MGKWRNRQYATALKSVGAIREGSSPSLPTTYPCELLHGAFFHSPCCRTFRASSFCVTPPYVAVYWSGGYIYDVIA